MTETTATNAPAEEPKKFNLIAALVGRSFPKETVTVFLDEALMYEYAKAARASDLDPADKGKELIREEMAKAFAELKMTVTVQGIPRHVRKAVLDAVRIEHPAKQNAFMQDVPDPVADELVTLGYWKQAVVEMTSPDGEAFLPTEEDIESFRANAPDSSVMAVDQAIFGMHTEAGKGYEQAVQELDFLSQASPKA